MKVPYGFMLHSTKQQAIIINKESKRNIRYSYIFVLFCGDLVFSNKPTFRFKYKQTKQAPLSIVHSNIPNPDILLEDPLV
jgi:hypothetical protein